MSVTANKAAEIPAWLQNSEAEKQLHDAPDWLIDFRKQQWQAFLENGLPSRKDERWKYADLSFLANQNYSAAKCINLDRFMDVIYQHRLQKGDSFLMVMVNGHFLPEFSDLAKLPQGVIACGMREALVNHADIVRANLPKEISAKKYPFGSLNAAMFTDGLFLHLAEGCELTAPIHFLSLALGENEFIANPYNMIILEKDSKLVLAEEHFSTATQSYMMNCVTTVNVGQNARFEHCKIQHEGKKATHMANCFIRQKQNSFVSHVNISSGSLFARDDLNIKLLEFGADSHTAGFYRLRHVNQYIDNHIDIDHAAPHSNSNMLYKGIVDNKARAVFNGRLHVEKDAQKILAYQANHNLLLSNEAEVYSKPELEIYADDVKCKHGATTGQLDQDALFYLRSRGIPRAEAIDILLQGYAEEILQRITHEGIKLRVLETL